MKRILCSLLVATLRFGSVLADAPKEKNDFKPVVGHSFNLRADWGAVDCQVQTVEPNKTLSYTWGAYGIESVVTWTLTPTSTGTHLRMEQSGFRPDQQQAYQGAKHGWQGFFAALEQVLARID